MILKTYVISHNRPQNTKWIIMRLWLEDITFVVWEWQERLYKMFWAKKVVGWYGLMEARNFALEDAFKNNAYCLQVSDDFTQWYENVIVDWKKKWKKIEIKKIVESVYKELSDSDYYFAWLSPTTNALNYTWKDVSNHNFVVWDFIMFKPNPLRFDENIRLKEDYDMTCQHLKEYWGVVRCNKYSINFKHYDNAGGAVEYRNTKLEQKTISQLKRKRWERIKDNPKRENEVILRYKK